MEALYPFTRTQRLREQDYPDLYRAMAEFCATRQLPMPDIYIGSIDREYMRKSIEKHATYPKFVTDEYVDAWLSATEWNALYSYPSTQTGPKGAIILGRSLAEGPIAQAMGYFAHEIGHMRQSINERTQLQQALGMQNVRMVLECMADHDAANEGYAQSLIEALGARKNLYAQIGRMESIDPFTLVAFYGTEPLSVKRRDYIEKYRDHATISQRIDALRNEAIMGLNDVRFNPDCTIVTPVAPICRASCSQPCR